MSAADLFSATYGRTPDGVWSAPGRVNLIGEHTDYSGGLVLPFALDVRASLAAARIDEPVVRLVSAQRPGAVVEAPLAVLTPGSASATGWPGYVFGVIWALIDAGIDVPGLELAMDSSVPAGAGLSSSAAVECATGLAAAALAGSDRFVGESGLQELARLAQRAENEFVGVPCGLMDQMASATCRTGHLLYFDVGSGTTEHIPFDPAAHGLQLLVIDTRAHHSLADGEYARRRADCERAADLLGLDSLRAVADLDSTLGTLTAASDGAVLIRRVRHVVTENERVRRVVAALRDDRIDSIGVDLTASHMSLRDDYQVSSSELDVAVDAALGAGALGARMTGGGFGGSAIALIPVERAEDVRLAVENAFAAAGFAAPVIRSFVPADGARRDVRPR